jgi:hypothetical protein
VTRLEHRRRARSRARSHARGPSSATTLVRCAFARGGGGFGGGGAVHVHRHLAVTVGLLHLLWRRWRARFALLDPGLARRVRSAQAHPGDAPAGRDAHRGARGHLRPDVRARAPPPAPPSRCYAWCRHMLTGVQLWTAARAGRGVGEAPATARGEHPSAQGEPRATCHGMACPRGLFAKWCECGCVCVWGSFSWRVRA